MVIKTLIAGTVIGSLAAHSAHAPAMPQSFPIDFEKLYKYKSPEEQHIESSMTSSASYAYQTTGGAYRLGAFQGGPDDRARMEAALKAHA